MDSTFDNYKIIIDEALEKCFKTDESLLQATLLSSMSYSLTAGGKRIRPILVLAFCAAAGGSYEKAMPMACAIEMLHTYTLIHDDLPCMDNDALRRGKPTNHMVYGEGTATLAGDALQAEAFGAILRSDLAADIRLSCAQALADAAGADGVCGGQMMDMEGETRGLTADELQEMVSGKTASLIICACKMGAICGSASQAQIEAACFFGASLGIAFQIRDDMLDVLSTETELGKTVGSDKRDGKTTFMSIYGEAKCQQLLENLTTAAKAELSAGFDNCEELCRFVDELVWRNN